ncbi:MAG: outer membrane beta-barrel protein [Ferrovibrio sp.]|uniref:outer membrane protein n=1 Tax=Ferrovibrio sp. TaxID=1917215 RepID=UPI00260963BA|nr:outer membrane beta-barrel protein [Ferrovibrio sp.]MCW0236712.1 outer membrane beta-barrel protein [Ferrovibrio sp.]
MRGTVVGFIVALVGLGGGALAQPAPAKDWSGLYVGGLLGGTDNQSQVKTTAGSGSYFNATDEAQIGRAGDSDLSQWRPSGGLVGGYGKQFGKVLVGIEVSANTLFLDEDHSVTQTYQSLTTAQFTLKQSVSADWMATVRPRLGWAEDSWLAYVTGGLAVTRLKLDTTFTDNAFSANSHSSDAKTVTGWSLGLGGEYALNQDWSLRGDYLYTRFDKIKSSAGVTTTSGPDSMNHTADLDVHGVMIGVVYRFKGL